MFKVRKAHMSDSVMSTYCHLIYIRKYILSKNSYNGLVTHKRMDRISIPWRALQLKLKEKDLEVDPEQGG
jgi:hypothetical protein